MPDKYPHIFLSGAAETEFFTTRKTGRDSNSYPERDRSLHSARLLRDIREVWRRETAIDEARQVISLPSKDGTYLEFKSKAGFALVTKSLENLPSKIRLLNIKKAGVGEEEVTIATVFVPNGKEGLFIEKIEAYAQERGQDKLITSIEEIRIAILSSFWQDDISLMPNQGKEWCEVWLRTPNGLPIQTYSEFRNICDDLQIEYKSGYIKFPERTVALIKVSRDDLEEILIRSEHIAEFRRSKEAATFWMDLPNSDQAEWTLSLLDQVSFMDKNVSVCILDTGANHGHPLLTDSLSNENCLAVDPSWGTSDHHPDGHGTGMCGIALYGDLSTVFQQNLPLEINHRLESVKILPPQGGNDPELWGYVTVQAVSRIEIAAPDRQRIHCMAVSSGESRDQGRPSSWSAAIDQVAAGDSDGKRRLIIVCAGNVSDSSEWASYPSSNLTLAIHDPGQAWNALTVGAITFKSNITDPTYNAYKPIAINGCLSPFSTTSTLWDARWPLKPEIVVEGGNAGIDSSGFTTHMDDLSVLTTHHNFTDRNFSVMRATSAATAEASRIAAKIQAEYPNAWPETIRALMIHSATWTDQIKEQFGIGPSSGKTEYAQLLRICGYGVPDAERALYCARNSLTLIAQEDLQPYAKRETGGGYCTKDMHVYELPWPKDVLLGLGNTPVQLKVTLSYFIEPGPGEIGWRDRYRYPSYGLRFDLNAANENKSEFVYRLNKAADLDEGSSPTTDSGTGRWLIGSNTRHLGSVHSDVWNGTAAEVATCNMIGIYPIIGWWRERAHLGKLENKARYSLITSLHTPDQTIDIYTPVAIPLQIPIGVFR